MKTGALSLGITAPRRPPYGPNLFTSAASTGTVGYATYDGPSNKWTVVRDAGGSGVLSQSGFAASTRYLVTFDFTREGGQPSFAIDIRSTSGTGAIDYLALNPAAGAKSVIVTTGNSATAIAFVLPGVGYSGGYANIQIRKIL